MKVSNTSPKNLVYNVFIAGRDARDFSVPKGSMVTIPPKSTLPLSVEFKSRFLRPAEAVLVLVGRRQGAATGNTLTFNLTTEIDNIKPKVIILSYLMFIDTLFLFLIMYFINTIDFIFLSFHLQTIYVMLCFRKIFS